MTTEIKSLQALSRRVSGDSLYRPHFRRSISIGKRRTRGGAGSTAGLDGLIFREPAIQPDLDPLLALLPVQEGVNLQKFAGGRPALIEERAKLANAKYDELLEQLGSEK